MAEKFEGVTVIDHPLVQHKLTIMRDVETSTRGFRQLLRETAALICYEATRDLPLETVHIRTPLTEMDAKKIAGKKLVFASILRAGNGLLEGMLDLVPSARVAHIGIYRNPETLQPVEYYFKAPEDLSERTVIAVDPMLATGELVGGGGRPAEEPRRQGHPLRLPARGAGRHPALQERPPGGAGVHRGDRQPPERPRLHRAGPRRRRRPDVRDEVTPPSDRQIGRKIKGSSTFPRNRTILA